MIAALGPRYDTCTAFLYYEAEVLDDLRYDDWLALLAPDVDYRIPTRITRERGALRREFSDASFYMLEDLGSLTVRVRRFDTDYAFAEDPPTRTRRVIGNIRTSRTDDDNEIDVKSNFILCRTKSDHTTQLLAGERHDVLRFTDGEPRLRRRVVLLEHTSLPMENLAIFL